MERSDIFISYRRKDVDFVKQLDAAFKAKGREVWIDWEDIPPGVRDFSAEITRGVDGSDVFIAVLSPHYLESPYCISELEHAAQQGKKIVPVVYGKFEGMNVPASISHINWVYFCEHAGQANTFEESFPKLLKAIETDHDYVREHTRLLLRAKEWEGNQREKSYLMDGAEILEAENWLATAANKTPSATELQISYIQASQHAERERQAHELRLQRKATNRLRYLAGVMLVAALLTGGLLLYVVLLQQQREQERIEQFYKSGDIYLEAGNYSGAVVEYTNSLGETADSDSEAAFDETQARYKRGLAQYGLGHYAKAITDLTNVIEADSNFTEAYNARGLAYYALEKYEAAIGDYDKAIALKPDFAEAYNNRGLANFAKGNYDVALQDFELALSHHPDFAEAYNNQGLVFYAKADYQKAKEAYEAALRIRRDYAEAFNNLGLVFAAMNDERAAIGNFTQAAINKVGYAEAYFNLAVAFNKSGVEREAIKNYEFALQFDSNYAQDVYFITIFPDTPTPDKVIGMNLVEHTVQPGDTLVKLAVEYGTPLVPIMERNNLTRAVVPVGTVLEIPTPILRED